jgi:hypothetical protein
MMGNVVAARPTWHPAWGLGASAVDTLLTKAPSIAADVAVQTGAIAAGSLLSVALPVVGVVLGAIIGSLFASHAARVAGAKQENQVLNSLIPTVQQAVTTVFDHLNNGSANPQDGASALDQIEQQYWQAASQVEHSAGQAGGPAQCVSNPRGGLHITGTPAVQDPPGSDFSGYDWKKGKSCTASCGIGCMWVRSWVEVGKKLIQAGGGQVTFDAVVGNKYGLQNFPGLSISYTPPPPGSVAALTGSGLLSGSVMGIPIWMLLAGLIAWKVL